MKATIEIDCSPEEARQFLGLPDVEKANAAYIDNITAAMKGVTSVEQMEQFAKQLAPMGQMGMKIFQNLVGGAQKTTSPAAASKNKKTDS